MSADEKRIYSQLDGIHAEARLTGATIIEADVDKGNVRLLLSDGSSMLIDADVDGYVTLWCAPPADDERDAAVTHDKPPPT